MTFMGRVRYISDKRKGRSQQYSVQYKTHCNNNCYYRTDLHNDTMKKLIFAAMLLPVLLFTQSCDDPKRANNYNNESGVDALGNNFIKGAIEGSNAEVKASKVAESRSTNPKVTEFAKMMINDHTSALEKLYKLKKKELVEGPYKLDQPHQKLIDSLATLSGDQFDRAYMQAMVADHEKAVDLFKEATGDRHGAVQTCARDLLPKIEEHLNSAKSIFEGLK